MSAPVHNVQTTLVPAGGAAIAQFKVTVPGTFILVDHSLTRAFNKGALGQLKVSGDEAKDIYSGKIDDLVYMPEGAGARNAEPVQSAPGATNKTERIAQGEGVFKNNCMACHQEKGEGIPQTFPPLAKSDYLNKDKIRAIKTITGGLQGKVTVNGQEYNGVMPSWNLSDEDIADVMTYIYNSWSNSGKEVKPDEVKTNRVKDNKTAP